MSSLLDEALRKKFLKNLFSWYDKSGRHDMPWRHTKDPYAVFVSEFMLQQTTVATVRPYYERFLKRFPTIKALARSPLNDVLALWSGLGYYARARNLWSAMQSVEKEFKGRIPSEVERLLSLPGVGPYTAGAISTIAFNRPASVLDGNIIRVLMRVLALDEDPKLKAVQILLNKTALDLSEDAAAAAKKKLKHGPRDLSLALMDLGSTICVPRTPLCEQCPVAEFCLAKKYNRQQEIPKAGDKIERPTLRRLHAVVEYNGKWLMGQRPKEGLFGGLWEFVGADAQPNVETVLFLEETVGREAGVAVRVQEAMPAFDHQLTHKVFIVRAYRCELARNSTSNLNKKGTFYQKFKWVAPKEIGRLGVSAVTKRVIALLK